MFIRPPLVWEVRASPPRTNCPVTLVLPEEEPRAVSPLAKKRSPKRRIDFRNDEKKQSTGPVTESSSEDGATSWADMVKNGYQRSNNARSIVKGKENDENAPTKQNKHYDYHREHYGRDISYSSTVQGSTSNKENTAILSKYSKEADQCCTESCGSDVARKNSAITSFHGTMSPCPDKTALSVESGTMEDTASIPEDEGWEVVSRSRGKPSRKGFSKIHSVACGSIHTFPVPNDISNCTDEVECGSCKQNYDHDGLGSYGDVVSDHNDNLHVTEDDNVDIEDDIDHDHDRSCIDLDHHPQNHNSDNDDDDNHDGNDFDHNDYDDPVDTENYCVGNNWQSMTDIKENNSEDNHENMAVNSGIDAVRAISPYLQVSKD